MYATGLGVLADDQEAAFWYRKAAEQGDENAQFYLDRVAARVLKAVGW